MLGCVDLTGTIFRLGGAQDKTFQGGPMTSIIIVKEEKQRSAPPPPTSSLQVSLELASFFICKCLNPVCYEFSSSAAYLITDWIDPMEQVFYCSKTGHIMSILNGR